MLDIFVATIYNLCSDRNKRGEKMSGKRGRPQSDNKKDTMIRVRLDNDMAEKLKIASRNFSVSKSDVVRKGIENEYQRSLKK